MFVQQPLSTVIFGVTVLAPTTPYFMRKHAISRAGNPAISDNLKLLRRLICSRADRRERQSLAVMQSYT